MNHRSLERAAYLRSAEASSFKIDPLAFTEGGGFSNQSRPSSTEVANQQIPVTVDAEQAVISSEVATLPRNGVIVEKPYLTPALELGAAWYDKVDPMVM